MNADRQVHGAVARTLARTHRGRAGGVLGHALERDCGGRHLQDAAVGARDVGRDGHGIGRAAGDAKSQLEPLRPVFADGKARPVERLSGAQVVDEGVGDPAGERGGGLQRHVRDAVRERGEEREAAYGGGARLCYLYETAKGEERG